MINSSKTYTVELVDGTFEGPKVISSNPPMQFKAFYFHRNGLSTIKKRGDIGSQGVYFLFRREGSNIDKIYVGQTKVGIGRIDTHCHNKSKDWFEYCCLLTWQNLDPIDGNVLDRLEEMYIKLLKNNKSYVCDNSQDNHSHLSSTIESQAMTYCIQLDFLLQACGINIYQDVDSSNCGEKLIFKMNRNGLNSRLQYIPNEGKFIVLQGSEVDMQHTAVCVTGDAFRRRMELFNGSNSIELLGCDVDFYSASAASSFVIGNSSNGIVDWVLESIGMTPLKYFLE